MSVASCLYLLCYGRPSSCLRLWCGKRCANGPREVENGTAQAEEKSGHASDRNGCAGDEASGVEVYKCMEARITEL